jgi:hypothetical protein
VSAGCWLEDRQLVAWERRLLAAGQRPVRYRGALWWNLDLTPHAILTRLCWPRVALPRAYTASTGVG